MRKALIAVAVTVAGLGALAVSMWVASEAGEEIVTLRTFAADGEAFETRVWIVDEAGASWLRSGSESSWLRRIGQDPTVEIARGAAVSRFHAVPVAGPEARDRIHAWMRAKYGLADWWLALLLPRDGSVAIRLDALDDQRD